MNSVALRPIDPSDWTVMREQAKVLITTGFLPEAIKTAEQAIAVMMKGRELNIPPMYALSNIVIIKGKPAASAELMLALIYRDHGDDAIRFTEATNKKCTIRYKRRSWTQTESYSFTEGDAEAARLLDTDTWKKYRPAMLRARCISAVARMGFPDTIGGLYTPEELGAVVAVNEREEVETIPNAEPDTVNQDTGEIVSQPQIAAPRAPVAPAKRPLTDDEINDGYDKLIDRAIPLSVPYKNRLGTWSRSSTIEEGTGLRNRIRVAEDQAAAKA